MTCIRWYGVDLDGTLAFYKDGQSIWHIGAPIEPMVFRVKTWIAQGETVRIFTARVSEVDGPHGETARDIPQMRKLIEAWCLEHLGVVLPITNVKEHGLIELWDDRAVGVAKNTGYPARWEE